MDLVDWLATLTTISADDYAMKLALFHTIFNVIGVLVVAPFTKTLVRYLETLFCVKEEGRGEIAEAYKNFLHQQIQYFPGDHNLPL